EHLQRGIQITAVIGGVDQADTRRRAAPDLILQARPAAMSEECVAAIADAKHLLQLKQYFLDRVRARKRPEQLPGRPLQSAPELQPRKFVTRSAQDVGEGLVVPEYDVVARPVRLDQIALQQQRVGLR